MAWYPELFTTQLSYYVPKLVLLSQVKSQCDMTVWGLKYYTQYVVQTVGIHSYRNDITDHEMKWDELSWEVQTKESLECAMEGGGWRKQKNSRRESRDQQQGLHKNWWLNKNSHAGTSSPAARGAWHSVEDHHLGRVYGELPVDRGEGVLSWRLDSRDCGDKEVLWTTRPHCQLQLKGLQVLGHLQGEEQLDLKTSNKDSR